MSRQGGTLSPFSLGCLIRLWLCAPTGHQLLSQAPAMAPLVTALSQQDHSGKAHQILWNLALALTGEPRVAGLAFPEGGQGPGQGSDGKRSSSSWHSHLALRRPPSLV